MRTLPTLFCLLALAVLPACAMLDAVNPWSGDNAPARDETDRSGQADAPAPAPGASGETQADTPSRSWFSWLNPWSDAEPEGTPTATSGDAPSTPASAPAATGGAPSASGDAAQPARSWFSFLNPWSEETPEPATAQPAAASGQSAAAPSQTAAASGQTAAASKTAARPATEPGVAAPSAPTAPVPTAAAPIAAAPDHAAPVGKEKPWYAFFTPWSDDAPAAAAPAAAPVAPATAVPASTDAKPVAPAPVAPTVAALPAAGNVAAAASGVPTTAGRYAYRYYPDDRVYFDLQRKTYFYYDKGDWQENAVPPQQVGAFLGRYVILRSDAFPPWEANRDHMRAHPPTLKTREGLLLKP